MDLGLRGVRDEAHLYGRSTRDASDSGDVVDVQIRIWDASTRAHGDGHGAPRTDLGDKDGDEEEQGGQGYIEGQEGGRSVKTNTTPSNSVWL